MKKVTSIFIALFVVAAIAFVSLPTQAKETTLSLQELIQTLQEQIEVLKNKILSLQTELQTLQKAEGEVKEATKEIKTTLKLVRQLWRGVTGDDVALLQEILATDPDIYPEGLITGYFGPLTEKAVKKFQQKMGVEQVGRVGPKTIAKINELLEEGAGSSGKVPPGLLIAPGISKKIGYTPTPPADQELPPGIQKKLGEEEEEEDETPPVISGVAATDITATTAHITWTTDEDADSVVWYDTVTPLIITASTSTVNSFDLTDEHDLLLDNLTASTIYYYLVTSADEEDNKATSAEESFTTLSE